MATRGFRPQCGASPCKAPMNSYPPPPPSTRTSNQLGKSIESRPYRNGNFALDHPWGPSGSSLGREELNLAKIKLMKLSPLQFLPGLLPHSSKDGLTSLYQIISFAVTFSYICFKNKLNIPTFVTGILAGLVSITGKLICVDFCS